MSRTGRRAVDDFSEWLAALRQAEAGTVTADDDSIMTTELAAALGCGRNHSTLLLRRWYADGMIKPDMAMRVTLWGAARRQSGWRILDRERFRAAVEAERGDKG